MKRQNRFKTIGIAKSISIAALASISFSGQVSASEHPGKALHESSNCMQCHASKPYDPKKSDSYTKLVKTVAFCNSNLNKGLFDDEVEQLADYLNETYYKHSK